MEVVRTHIDGVLLIKPKVWGDARGYFVETWQQERYAEIGIGLPFVQDNHSRSSYGVLRGLHFQKTRPQGKLVSVSLGSVFDVAVDIRRNSPTFGQWYGVELTRKTSGNFGSHLVWPTALWSPAKSPTFITNVRTIIPLGTKAPIAGMIQPSISIGR